MNTKERESTSCLPLRPSPRIFHLLTTLLLLEYLATFRLVELFFLLTLMQIRLIHMQICPHARFALCHWPFVVPRCTTSGVNATLGRIVSAYNIMFVLFLVHSTVR